MCLIFKMKRRVGKWTQRYKKKKKIGTITLSSLIVYSVSSNLVYWQLTYIHLKNIFKWVDEIMSKKLLTESVSCTNA